MSIITQNAIVLGDSGDNQLSGAEGDEIIHGLGGADEIFGGVGDDTLIGGEGADILGGDGGADVLYGGVGDDILVWESDLETDPDDIDRLWGEDGTDTLILSFAADDYTLAIANEIGAFADALAAGQDPGAGGEFSFLTMQLRVLGIEAVRVFIDGEEVAPGEPPTGTAVDDAFAADGAGALTASVLDNDGYDAERQSLQLLQDAVTGALEFRDDGSFSYSYGEGFAALAAGETATDSFTYAILQDGTQLSTATVTITIIGANDAPTAIDIERGGNEDDPISFNLLTESEAEDVDNGDTLTIAAIDGVAIAAPGTSVTLASGAVVTASPDGTFTYDPAGAFDFLAVEEGASDTLTFTVTDAAAETVTRTLEIFIDGVNDAPVAVDDAATTDEESAVLIDVLANDFDLDGVPQISGFDAEGDGGGRLVAGDVGLIFTPDGDFDFLAEGETAVTTFEYEISDNSGGSDAGTVTVTVTGVNDGPTANDAATMTDEDSATSFNLVGLSGATDPDDGDVLSITAFAGQAITAPTVIVLPQGGAFTVNPSGLIGFDPAGGFDDLPEGEARDVTVDFAISDLSGATVTRSLTLTVTGVNDAPVAVDDAVVASAEATTEVDVLANDFDPDDGFSISAFDSVGDAGGVLRVVGETLVFDPNGEFDALAAGEVVETRFTYTITDEAGESATATITVRVTGGNEAPTGEAVLETTDEDSALTFNLIDASGATDPDAGDTLTVVAINGVGLDSLPGFDTDLGVRASIDPDGTLVYDPSGLFDALDEGESAFDGFTFTIADSFGATFTESATIVVTGVNDAPETEDDDARTTEDAAVAIDVLANDFDPDDPLSIGVFDTVGSGGGVVSAGAGGLIFDPNGEFETLAEGDSAVSAFTYTLIDDDGETSTATVTVVIDGVNDDPTAADVARATDEDSALAFNLLDASGADDVDDGDVLSVLSINDIALNGSPLTITTAGGGALTVTPDGAVSYDPSGAFDALDTGDVSEDGFSFTITDAFGATVERTVTIEISGVNDAPLAVDDAATVDEDSAVGIDVLANDVDPDDAPEILDFDAMGDLGGLVSRSDTGLVFDAAGDFDFLAEGDSLDTTFSYTITDDDGETSTASVTVTVTGVNDAPEGDDVFTSTDEDTGFTLNILDESGAFDIDDGDVLELFSINGLPLDGQTVQVFTDNGAILDVSPDGTVDYDPAGAFDFLDDGETLEDSFTFTVTDSFGETYTRSATVEITGVNDAPEVQEITIVVREGDEGAEIDLLDGASDRDTFDTLDVQAFTQVSGRDVFADFQFAAYKFEGQTAGGLAGTPNLVGDVTGDGIADYSVRVDAAGGGVRTLLLSGEAATLSALDLADGVADGVIDLALAADGGVGAAPLFSQTLTGAQLLSDPSVSFFDGAASTTVDGTALDIVSGGGEPLMMLWDLLPAAARGALAVTITVDYTPESGDNDLSFGLTDGTDLAGWERADNSGGSWFTRDGAFGDNLPGFTFVAGGLGAVEPFTQNYVIRDEDADTSMTITEGADSFSYAFGADLDSDAPLSFAFFGNSSGERYQINSVSIEVFGIADAAIATVNGSTGTRVGDLNGDGIDDLVFSDGAAGTGGEIYVVFGGANLLNFGPIIDPSAIDGTNGFVIGGADAGDDLKYIFSQTLGDIDGDGIADFLAGARLADSNGLQDAGEAYLISGGDLARVADPTGFVDVNDLLASQSYRIEGTFGGAGTPGQLGNAVAGGDIDGDGIADLLIAAPRAGGVDNRFETGEAYIVFGDRLEDVDLADGVDDNTLDANRIDGQTGFRLLGGEPLDRTGISIQVIGDVNGDGIDDLIVGADEAVFAANTGEAYLVFGGLDNLAAFDSADGSRDGAIRLQDVAAGGFGYLIEGETGAELFGNHVSRAGDVDGDGVEDFLIGNVGLDVFNAVAGDPEGRARLLYGGQLDALDTADGETDNILRVASLDVTTGLVFTEEAEADAFGARSTFGDFDGDGALDVLISATSADVADGQGGTNADAGAAYLFRGFDGFAALDALDGVTDGFIDAAAAVGALTDFSEGAEGAFSFSGTEAFFDTSAFQDLGEGEEEEIVIEYEVTDGDAAVVNTLTIIVEGENDDPVGAGAELETDEDTSLADNLIIGRTTDVDANDTLAVSQVNGADLAGGQATVAFASGAEATILEDGTILFDPAGFYDDLAEGETVVERFTFVVADDKGGTSDDQTATITITGVNDAPVGDDLAVTTNEDDTVAGSLLDGASDPDGDEFGLASVEGQSLQDAGLLVTLASGATVFAGIDGGFTYDPNDAFESLAVGETATDSFTYTLSDAFGASTEFTATVTVEGRNDAAGFAGTRATAVSLVSVTGDGAASGDLGSITPQISADGASVVFTSNATNLVTPDANGDAPDIFLADLDAGTLEQVNLIDGTSDQSADATTVAGAVDGLAGGRWSVFHTGADDLSDQDDNGQTDVYLRDLLTGATELISINLDGASGNNGSLNGSASADGRYVAFQSTATDLIDNDENGTTADVYLRDRTTGETIKISSPDGGNNRFSSFNPRISEDGSTVVFATFGALVDEDVNGVTDIYAYDVASGTLELVSLGDGGALGNGGAQEASVSANGRYVFFSSDATNLVAGDTNGLRDGFVYDRETGSTERVTVSTSGFEADAAIAFGADFGQISADGRFVIFTTAATNLDEVSPDTNGENDVYLHDRLTGETVRLSATLDLTGQPGGFMPSISADGTRAAFATFDDPDPLDPRGVDDVSDIYVADIDINGAAFATDDGTVTIDLLDGYSDPEGDDLDVSGVTVTSDGGRSVAFSFDAEAGTLTIDAAQFEDNAPGDYELLTISYSIDGADGESVGAVAGASVFRSIPAGGGGGAVAVDDSFATDEETTLSASVADNDTPAVGGVYTLIDGPFGDLSFNPDGSFDYDPRFAFEFLGDGDVDFDSFTYELAFNGEVSQGTVEIEITGVNDLPGFFLPTVLEVNLVSVDAGGGAGAEADAFAPDISGDGAFISFESVAGNLVDDDGNGLSDIFVGTGVFGDDISRQSLVDGGIDETTDGGSFAGSVAADGTVAFQSDATDLAADDGGDQSNIFVREGFNEVTEIVSLNFDGEAADGASFNPSITDDGRYVAFESAATDLVRFSGDDNGAALDIFVHDRLTGETFSITQDSDRDDFGASFAPTISADGSRVVFLTENDYDVEDDNGLIDVYAYDLKTGELIYVSQGFNSSAGDGDAILGGGTDIAATSTPTISDNGRYVAFVSQAENMTPDDNNGVADVFLFDTLTGDTRLVSKSLTFQQGDGASYAPAISGDGRFVAYETLATNLDLINGSDFNGVADVMVFDQITNDVIRVSQASFFDFPGGAQPAISDDGGRIVFVSNDAGLYDDRVTTTDVQNVYLAEIDTTGGTVTDKAGVLFIDLTRDIFDPEDDRLFFDNIEIFSDNLDRVVEFEQPIDGDGQLLPGIEIDFSQFADLGVNEYELLTVTYDLSDDPGAGFSSPGTTAIVVEGENDAPEGADGSFTANPGGTVTGDIAVLDIDGDELTYIADAASFPGTFQVFGDGTFSATFDAGATGSVDVQVEARDPFGGSTVVTLTFDINEPPDFGGFAGLFSAVFGEEASLDLGAAFNDPAGGDLTFDAVRVGGGALPNGLSIDPDTGVISGQPLGSGGSDLVRVAVTATNAAGASTTAETWLSVTDNIVTGTDAGDVLTPDTTAALSGSTGSLVIGGLGDDFLSGGTGRDIYLWRPGDGFDLIVDDGAGGIDQVLVSGADLSDLVFSRFGATTNDLLVETKGTEGTFTDGFVFRNGLIRNSSLQLDEILFDDGTVFSLDDIRMAVTQSAIDAGGTTIAGTEANETISGADGAVLIGNLSGNNGPDTFVYNPGDGAIAIDANGSNPNTVIQFGFNLTDPSTGEQSFAARRVPGTLDLVLDFGGGDVLTVVDTLEDLGGEVGDWVFLDATVDTGFFRDAVLSGEATPGDDILLGFDGSNISDTLAGGAGDDYLAGDDGADVYSYVAGGGNDTIEDAVNDIDVLNVSGFELILDGDGLVDPASEVTFRRVSRDGAGDPRADDLLIELDGLAGTGSITILDQLDTLPAGSIRVIDFLGLNSTVSLDVAAIRAQLIAQEETDGDDVVRGFDQSSDTIEGGLGDDLLIGGDSTDLYLYAAGDGDDTIADDGAGDQDRVEVSGFDLIFDADGLVSATSEVQFSAPEGSQGDLKISLDNGTETGSILVEGFFVLNGANVIENFAFIGDAGTAEIGFDALYAEFLNRQITEGDDIILTPIGARYDETVASGPGDDIVGLGVGADTYQYAAGDGRLRIIETGFAGSDTLEISGYTFDQLEFDVPPFFLIGSNPLGKDLRIRPTSPTGADDEIIILNGFNSANQIGIETIVDAAGATMTKAEAIQLVIDTALAKGEPFVSGSNAGDAFASTIGADVFVYGEGGADTYNFTAGDGWDTYREDGFGGSETVNLVGYSSTDVGATISFQTGTYRPNDVWIDFGGGDRLYLANANQFETIVFTGDGASFNASAFATLVAANATTVADIDGAGDFAFTSTAADERLDGQGGTDTATFSIGAIGHDVVQQGGQGRVNIVIDLGATGEVTFERGMLGDGSDLLIKVFEAGATRLEDVETIRLVDFERAANTSLQTLTLIINGVATELSVDDVMQAAVDDAITAGDDAVYGFSGAIVSIADGRGNDVITGGPGDDVLKGFGGVEDNLDDLSQQDVYQFTVGAGGTGGDGRDYIFDDAFGDGDRIEFVSGDGAGSASLDNVRIYFAPDNIDDIVFDFGHDELRVANFRRQSVSDQYQEVVFDLGGAGEVTMTDDEVIALAVAAQTTDGDDVIFGSPLADVLTGGPGDDLLQGFGNPQGDPTDPAVADIYLFNVGSGGSGGGGSDVIFDNAFGDTDVIRITSDGETDGAPSASLANATLRRDDADEDSLVIDFGGDRLTIRDFFSSSITTEYAQIVFDFGGGDETFTKEELLAEFVARSATDGDDVIIGTYLDEEIRGGLGDDTIEGSGGSDTYVFTPGQGDDVMRHPGGNGQIGTVRIEADFADVELFKRGSESEDLLVRFDAGGSVLIIDAFLTNNSGGEIDALVFDDVSFTPEEVQALALAADLGRGAARLVSDNFDDVDRAIDTDGDGVADVTVGAFRGTATDEFMSGRDGGDTYVYTVGDGSHDVIHDDSFTTNQTDTLVIDGAAPEDVIFARAAGDDDDLVIRFAGAEGSVRVLNTLDVAARDNIEQFTFIAPGGATTTLSLDVVRQRVFQDAATARDDRIVGVSGSNDTLSNVGADATTAGGSDVFIGLAGDDLYIFEEVAGITQRIAIEDNGGVSDADTLEVRGFVSTEAFVRRLAAGAPDLIIGFSGSDDLIVLNNVASADTADRIETFVFDDRSYTFDEVLAAADGDGTLGGIGVGPGAPLIGGPMVAQGGNGATDATGQADPVGDVVEEAPGSGAVEAPVITASPTPIASPTASPTAAASPTAGADRLIGGAEDEAIFGRGGDDTLFGRAGADTLKGGGGADRLLGGAGDDVLKGGAGDDLAKGQGGADRMAGQRGEDTLMGGGAGDTLLGGAGDDRLVGQAGRDVLKGGAGDDRLLGGAGADRMIGGAGDDTLKGGGGDDQFIFARGFGRDLVKDFELGADHLNFRGHSAVSAFEDLDILTVGGDAVIRDGVGGVLRLDGVDGDDLTADDFLF